MRAPVKAAPLEVESTPPSDDQSTRAYYISQHPKINSSLSVPSQATDEPLDEQQIARNVQALKARLRGRGGRRGGRGGGRPRTPAHGADSVQSSEWVPSLSSFSHLNVFAARRPQINESRRPKSSGNGVTRRPPTKTWRVSTTAWIRPRIGIRWRKILAPWLTRLLSAP